MGPNNGEFHKLLPHEFISSDFSASFMKGMFSCSACDDWRIRKVHGRCNKKAVNQSDLKCHYLRCQQNKRGKKPIRVRVVIGNVQNSEVVVTACQSATVKGNANETTAMAVVLDHKAAAKAKLNKKKDDAALEIRKKLALEALQREGEQKKQNILNQQLTVACHLS